MGFSGNSKLGPTLFEAEEEACAGLLKASTCPIPFSIVAVPGHDHTEGQAESSSTPIYIVLISNQYGRGPAHPKIIEQWVSKISGAPSPKIFETIGPKGLFLPLDPPLTLAAIDVLA